MSTASAKKGAPGVKRKIVSISPKRQITIPQKYYQALGFGTEAECVMRGEELVIRPVKAVHGGEFAEQILAELIAEGLSGDELLLRFKERQSQIRPAVESMLADAEAVAEGKGEFVSYNEVFKTED